MDVVALFAIFCIFGIPMSIPLMGIWTKHQREMMQLRLRMQQHGEANLPAEIHALRQEIHALRETSMQYDLSFDAALQRLEQRVGRVEQNGPNTVASSFRPSYDTGEVAVNLRADN